MNDGDGISTTDIEVESSNQHGVFKWFLLLLIVFVSVFLGIYVWDTTNKAQEESAQLKDELKRANGDLFMMKLILTLMSAFLFVVICCTWDTANKAREESAQLREQLDSSGTMCTVCLDNPRQVLLQPCGHVCMCKDCADRVRGADNQCPICRKHIEKMQPAYIS